jgi:hypothetical protein
MSQSSILRILPLLTFAIPVAALANAAAIVPMTLGKEYAGSLAPSASNPQGEVCYGLSAEPETRITLRVKTGGVGILKFAVYDQAKALRFFHNNVNSKPQPDGKTAIDSRFSFPAVSEVSQICLTTTNPTGGQQYHFIATAIPGRRSKSPLALRPVNIDRVKSPDPKLNLATNPPKATTSQAPPVPIPPQPTGEPYCYVGTWQIADLSKYWLPTIQSFTQANVTEPQMLGYAKVTLNKDGYATFEAFDLEQRYSLTTKETGAKIDRIGLGLSGSANAKFQVNPDSTLTFNSQNYQRLNTKLSLGDNLKLNGDRLFMVFGDRDKPAIKSSYKCLDRDNITLRIPLPTGQKSISIALKRIN